METLKIPFSSIGEDFRDTPFGKTFMNRLALRKRLKNTQASRVSFPSIVTKWGAADDNLSISIKYADTTFGRMLIGSTNKGICFVGFTNNNDHQSIADLKSRFPLNPLNERDTIFMDEAIKRLDNPQHDAPVQLHLKGTTFQLGIWERLLMVPFGGLITYSALGGSAKNARAVGTAVGANPVAYILPCHRVIRGDGSFDKFYWGKPLKEKLLAYEVITTISDIMTKGFKNMFISSPYSLN